MRFAKSAFAQLALRYPRLRVHAAYTDRHVHLVNEGFDAAVRIAYLADSNLVARRIAPIYGKFVPSPSYLIARGIPLTPDDLVLH